MRSSPLRALGAAASVLLLGSCEIEKVAIPPTTAIVSLHAVLSPTATTQVVLLERTRNGTKTLFGPAFDQADPVVSGDGVAESDAFIYVDMPDGTRQYAVEDKNVRGDFKGRGIYRLYVPGRSLLPDYRYRLHVLTAKGEPLLAETHLPNAAAADTAEAIDFDRSRDTLRIAWDRASGARSYWVRVETPFGPRYFFTDSTSVRLGGDLRNANTTALRHVFFPGFQQQVTVSAVDSNFYDWYRSANNELTGEGLVNRVSGGIGVFASLVRLRFYDAHVVAPQTQPATGAFAYARPDIGTTPYLAMELYLESKAARSDQADALSGRVRVRPRFGYTGCLTCGVLGTVKGKQVQLAFLGGWLASDTVETFDGEVRGDTLVGHYRLFGGDIRFVKQPR